MDIAEVSMALANASVLSQVGTAVLDKALDASRAGGRDGTDIGCCSHGAERESRCGCQFRHTCLTDAEGAPSWFEELSLKLPGVLLQVVFL